MYIKELGISNFKSFDSAPSTIAFNVPDGQTLGSGLNILVGENNTGKSTVFKAVDFVRNSTKKSIEAIRNTSNPNSNVYVEITFTGDIEQTIEGFSQDNKKAAFKSYIYQNQNQENLFKICRDSSDMSKLKLWDNNNAQFANESGIDAPLKKLFETNFIWADTNPNDEVAFGATTICGNLLKEIANGFIQTADYANYQTAFNHAFNNPNSGLRIQLQVIEQRVQQIFSQQFGNASISFHFDELKIDSFFKNTTIVVNDGVETSMQEKGNGMQRAVALALIQVYAQELIKHPDNAALEKPFFLFIDEPEICQHPKAQEKLLGALLEISRTKQVFVTTHSPYFLSTPYLRSCGLHIFSKNGNNSVVSSANLNPILPWSPTWGEINFKAYKLPTVEFHNEIYGHLQEQNKVFTESNFEQWINGQGIPQNKTWIPERAGVAQSAKNVSLQTFIRNKIHHPENVTMQAHPYTSDELKQSIEVMINLI